MKKITLALISLYVISFSGCKDNTTDTEPSSRNINLIGSYNTPGYANGVCASRINNTNYAFIANDAYGLYILNVNLNTQPAFADSVSTGGTALDVTVKAINGVPYAFVSAGLNGFVIINVSAPEQSFIDTTISFPGDLVLTSFVDTSSRLAFVGTFGGRMHIYDISNLPDPVTKDSTFYGYDNIMAIQVVNGLAYLAESSLGLVIINVTNPHTPSYVGGMNTPGLATDVKVSGNYAYVADGDGGLQIIEVTNPFLPSQTGFYKTSGASYLGLFYLNNRVYTSGGYYGIESVSVLSPSLPTQFGYYKISSGYATNIFVFNNYIYLAAGSAGLLILQSVN